MGVSRRGVWAGMAGPQAGTGAFAEGTVFSNLALACSGRGVGVKGPPRYPSGPRAGCAAEDAVGKWRVEGGQGTSQEWVLVPPTCPAGSVSRGAHPWQSRLGGPMVSQAAGGAGASPGHSDGSVSRDSPSWAPAELRTASVHSRLGPQSRPHPPTPGGVLGPACGAPLRPLRPLAAAWCPGVAPGGGSTARRWCWPSGSPA